MMSSKTSQAITRRPTAPGLPVVQIKPSHDLGIDSDQLPEQDVPAVIPASAAIAIGDQLGFTWKGYYAGQLESEWNQTLEVEEAQLGRPVVMRVPRIQVLLIDRGYAEVSYRLVSGNDGTTRDSPVQIFQIVPPAVPRLEPPAIAEHVAGEPIDPGDFPHGCVAWHYAYPGMQLDDDVVLYGEGVDRDRSFVASLRIDASHIQSGVVGFNVGFEWLSANEGATVALVYQFARPGAAGSSEPLVLDVRKAEPLPPPVVERAGTEGDPALYHGYLAAQQAFNGVYINVPETVPLAPTDRLAMHWQGHPAGGQYLAQEPVDDQHPRRFFIPASAVAANMGAGEAKRFEVFYRLTPASGKTRTSIAFGLRIVPLEQGRYPVIQWDRLAGGTTLSLQSVPVDGEPLRLDSWPFMGTGQRVTLQASGVAATGAPAHSGVRDGLPVTEQEMAAGQVRARVPRAFLQALKINEYITLGAAVSFDGGETCVQFLNNPGVRLVL